MDDTRSPTPVVLVLAVTDDGLILYTRRDSWSAGMWGLVAGFVEHGETAEAAALREVKEESGLDAHNPVFLRSMPFNEQLLLCFRVDLMDGEPIADSDVDQVELAPPEPDRMPEGAPARLLVERYGAAPVG